MARCIDCDREISRSFIRCYPCNRRHKNTPMTTTPPPPPDERKRPSYRDKAPQDWNYAERTAGPVIIHETTPQPPTPTQQWQQNRAKQHLTLGWNKKRRYPIDGKDAQG